MQSTYLNAFYPMPNRVIRSEILTSDAVNKLTWAAEVFYRRLMSVVDDYGRFDARNEILRSSIYPLQLNKVSESDIEKWMHECAKAGLVRFYRVDGKPYLEILKFGQILRIKKSKYPACTQMNANDFICMSETKRNETEEETNSNSEPPPKLPPNDVERPGSAPTYEQVYEYFIRSGETEKEARRFYEYYEGLNWHKGITPIAKWSSFAYNWISEERRKRNNKSQSPLNIHNQY